MFQSEREMQEKAQLNSASGQIRRELSRLETRNNNIQKPQTKDEKVVKLRPDLYDK